MYPLQGCCSVSDFDCRPPYGGGVGKKTVALEESINYHIIIYCAEALKQTVSLTAWNDVVWLHQGQGHFIHNPTQPEMYIETTVKLALSIVQLLYF